MYQEDLLICDNQSCGYTIKNQSGDPNVDISGYVNMPCPECGENLLTEKDYLQSLQIMKTINWLNKWFSWIMFFVPKNTKKGGLSVHVHDGVKIKKFDEEK